MRAIAALALGILGLVSAACSDNSSTSARVSSPVTTHPFGVSLTAIESFFDRHGSSPTSWSEGPVERDPGPLNGLDNYTDATGLLRIDAIGTPADETELIVNYTIVSAADRTTANAVMQETVQHFAPGAVDWIRGALRSTDGSAGYFGGSSANDTSGQIALFFSTSDTKTKGLFLVLAGGKTAD